MRNKHNAINNVINHNKLLKIRRLILVNNYAFNK